MESIEPITLSSLPVVEDSVEDVTTSDDVTDDIGLPSIDSAVESASKEKADPAAAIYAIPELASLGRVFRSCPVVPLTESETEYVVNCTKHIFESHVVLQFSVENTIDDQRLENVSVMLEPEGVLFEVTGEIPAPSIKYGETGKCFTVLERTAEVPLETTNFTSNLHFNVVQVDPASGEDESDAFEEEYPLEDLEIATADYMAKVAVPDFRQSWEDLASGAEIMERYALQFSSLEDAVSSVVNLLGMQPCDGTGAVKSVGKKPHMLHLSGVFLGGKSVFARAQMAMQGETGGVVLKIAVRSEDESIPRLVADCIR